MSSGAESSEPNERALLQVALGGLFSCGVREDLDYSRTALNVEVLGAGYPVVLAHGLGGSARNFGPQTRALRQLCRFILYDARGHARSEAPVSEHAYTLEALARDMAFIVEQHAGGSAILGGLSLGAATALKCALERPFQARALVLASLPGSGASRHAWALQFADAIDCEGLEQAGSAFVWGDRSRFDPVAAELIRRGWLEHAPHALAHLLRQTAGSMSSLLDEKTGLEQLEMPVLLIAGSGDRDAIATSEQLKLRLPRAHLEVIDGAGHVVNLVKPEQFNAHLSAFVQSLDPHEIQASR